MHSIKPLFVLFLSLPVLAAEPRFVTLQRGDTLTLKAGEAAEAASAIGQNLSLSVYSPGGESLGGFPLQGYDGKFPPLAIAGPASLSLVNSGSLGEVGSGFVTFRVWPGFTDPQAVALIPPGTNAVTVRLESSTNLVTWSAVHEVTLTNVPAATFYRAKASP